MRSGIVGVLKLSCKASASRPLLARHICQSARSLGGKGDSPSECPDVIPPAPGTVTEYAHHVFIRSPPEPTDEQGLGAWWPPVVERCSTHCTSHFAFLFFQPRCDLCAAQHRLPAFKQAFAAVAATRKSIEGAALVSMHACMAS